VANDTYEESDVYFSLWTLQTLNVNEIKELHIAVHQSTDLTVNEITMSRHHNKIKVM